MRRSVLLAGVLGSTALAATVIVAATASAGTSGTAYEAEATANVLNGSAVTATCEPCSGGQRVGWIGYSGRLTLPGVVAEKAGLTPVRITYTSPDPRSALLRVNRGRATVLTFPATGSPDTPGTLDVLLRLDAGPNSLTFGNPNGWAPDFDKITVNAGDDDAPEPTATPSGNTSPSPGATAVPSPPASPSPSPSPVEPSPVEPSPSPVEPSPSPAEPSPSPVPPSPSESARPPATGRDGLESEVARLVNVQRALDGCDVPLTVDGRLGAAARKHSEDMAAKDYFSHTSQDGTEFADRISRENYVWRAAGENIAKGQRTPAEVMNSWMNSSGHRANILNCSFRDIGVGVAYQGNTLIWTQDFGTHR